MIEAVLEAVTSPEFLDGLFAGAAVGAVTGVASVVSWRLWRRNLPLAGLAWCVACLVALEETTAALLLGVALLGAAGTTHERLGRFPWLRVATAAPGAWLVAHHTGLPGPVWVSWLVFGVVVAGGPLMAAGAGQIRPPGLGIGLWVITVGGVYGTVPDTEELLVLVGAALLLVGVVPFRIVSLGAAGSYAALGLLAWATATGGTGRPPSIVGGLACVGTLWLVPFIHTLRPTLSIGWLHVGAVHLLVVLICSRVAGLRQAVPDAVALALGAHLLGFLLLQMRRRTTAQGPT